MSKVATARQRESVGVLLTVAFDRAASTPWHELWHARSDSRLDLTLDVRYDVAAKTWTCQPEHCPGFRRWGRCHHCERCDRMRRINFYAALWAGQPASVLRTHLAHYQGRVDAGMADADDLAALDFIAIELGEEVAA